MDANLSGNEHEAHNEVMESLGETHGSEAEGNQAHEGSGEQENLPPGVKARLGRQEKRHQKEMRDLRSQLEQLHARQGQNSGDISSLGQPANPYAPQPMANGVEDHIQKAVSFALQHREMQEKKAKEAEQAAHVSKQYQEFHKHLDSMHDKYDDYHEKVTAQDVPFTPHMRDASLFLPKTGPGSAGEVLYKLGSNPDELSRISRLHPLDQAAEMVKLSQSLMGIADAKQSAQARPLGNIKSNPVTNSPGVTDKTSVSELRARMKQGWK